MEQTNKKQIMKLQIIRKLNLKLFSTPYQYFILKLYKFLVLEKKEKKEKGK